MYFASLIIIVVLLAVLILIESQFTAGRQQVTVRVEKRKQ